MTLLTNYIIYVLTFQIMSLIEQASNNQSNIEDICLWSVNDLFDVAPRYESEMNYVWDYICSLNTTRLTQELSDRFHVDQLLADMVGTL